MQQQPAQPPRPDPDRDKGAVEGDRPTDKQHYNHNAPGIDKQGLPKDRVKVAEDVIGANEDGTEG